MKLSELVEHTGKWLDFSATSVGSYARFLREARLISGGAKGGAAADMTARDMISLLLVVLGCNTARTCSKELPDIYSLTATKTDDQIFKNNKLEPPKFLAEPTLSSALIAMFSDLQSGLIDRCRGSLEQTMVQHGLKLVSPVQFDLTFTIDLNQRFAEISLRFQAKGKQSKQSPEMSISVFSNKQFGAHREEGLPGYSRRFHEVSYERLVGWGMCLNEAVS